MESLLIIYTLLNSPIILFNRFRLTMYKLSSSNRYISFGFIIEYDN